jgi:deoxycytidylate deaminase
MVNPTAVHDASRDKDFLKLAADAALLSPCTVKIGAVLVALSGEMFRGYNAPPPGHPDRHRDITGACDTWCPRRWADQPKRDPGYSDCPTVHAEVAVTFAAGRAAVGSTVYVTGAPCALCTRVLAHARVQRVVCVSSAQKALERGMPDTAEFLARCGIGFRWSDAP